MMGLQCQHQTTTVTRRGPCITGTWDEAKPHLEHVTLHCCWENTSEWYSTGCCFELKIPFRYSGNVVWAIAFNQVKTYYLLVILVLIQLPINKTNTIGYLCLMSVFFNMMPFVFFFSFGLLLVQVNAHRSIIRSTQFACDPSHTYIYLKEKHYMLFKTFITAMLS